MLRRLAFVLGTVVIVGLVIASRYQPFNIQIIGAGSSSVSTSKVYSFSAAGTLTFRGGIGVQVVGLRTSLVTSLPSHVGELTLCPHYHSSTFTCSHNTPNDMTGVAFRPFAMSRGRTVTVIAAFTLNCSGASQLNSPITVGFYVTYRLWWFTHTVLVHPGYPGYPLQSICPNSTP
jgi:hypothetical protein